MEKDLKEMLSKAVEMEKKGHNFYKEKAEQTKNELTKKTFSFLADKEILHIENIQKFIDQYSQNGKFPSFDIDSEIEKRKEEIRLFEKTLNKWNQKVKSDSSDKEALEFALDLEKQGYNFYKDILEEANDENLKKFLQFLMEEENEHYEEFMKVYEYLTDSSNWYMYEEDSFPQG